MRCFEIVVVKESNVSYNAKPIDEDGKLIGTAEKLIDIHLLDIRAGGSL